MAEEVVWVRWIRKPPKDGIFSGHLNEWVPRGCPFFTNVEQVATRDSLIVSIRMPSTDKKLSPYSARSD
jgi:hypothetical protein